MAGVAVAWMLLASSCSGSGSTIPRGGTSAGGEPVPGVDGNTIAVGSILPLEGIDASQARSLLEGRNLYWEGVNDEGGVAGRYHVDPRSYDGSPMESAAAMRFDEVSGDVLLVDQLYGTLVAEAIAPRLERDGLLGIPATFDEIFDSYAGLVPIGTPYPFEAMNLVAHHLETGGDDRVCVLRQEDTWDYGDAALDGATHALGQRQLEVAADVTFEVYQGLWQAKLTQLREAGCGAVVLAAQSIHLPSLMSEAQALAFEPRWLALSGSWSATLADTEVADYVTEHVWFASQVPAWGDDSIPAMGELAAAAEQSGVEPDSFVALGYAQAHAAHLILEKAAEAGTLDRESVRNALTSMGSIGLGGLVANSDYREGSRTSDRSSVIVRLDPSAAGDLTTVAPRFSSEDAQSYEPGTT